MCTPSVFLAPLGASSLADRGGKPNLQWIDADAASAATRTLGTRGYPPVAFTELIRRMRERLNPFRDQGMADRQDRWADEDPEEAEGRQTAEHPQKDQ